jgi:parallel beta-helix repeat protein
LYSLGCDYIIKYILRALNIIYLSKEVKGMFKPNRRLTFIMLACFLFVSVFGLLTPGAVFAEESTDGMSYYVSTSGDDSNAGTEAAPFKTIGHAVALAQNPGDIIFVMPGVYAEAFENPFPNSVNRVSWDTAVTIKAYDSSSKPVIKPGTGSRVFTFSEDKQKYIIIEDLIIDGTGISSTNISLTNGANHIRIKGCEILNNSVGSGITTDKLSGDNEFLNLNIHGFTGSSSSVSGLYIKSKSNLIEGNHIYNITFNGIQLYDGSKIGIDNNIVRNNIIHDIMSGSKGDGIVLGSGTGNIAYNNIVYNCKRYGIRDGYTGIATQILNNTIYNCGTDISIDTASSKDTVIKNNITYLGGTSISSSIKTAPENIANNLTGVDPKFYDAALGNFRLRLDSPAINYGTSLDLVAADIEGALRPIGNAFDAGAYEMSLVADTIPPATPAGLSVSVENDGSLKITWSPITDKDLAGYKIYLNGKVVNQVSPLQTSYIVTGLINGSACNIAVSAVDYSANESVLSEAVSVTVVDNMPPAIPAGLTTNTGNKGVELGTDPWENFTGYNVYVDGKKYNQAVITETSFTVENLINGKSYSFAISAVDASNNESALTEAVNAVPSEGKLYYVSKSGDDLSEGTEEATFLTITKGMSVLKPGDTLFVKDGTYVEGLKNFPAGFSWDSPITIKAYPGAQVLIQPAAGTYRVLDFTRSSEKYIVIDGFVLDAVNVGYDCVKITEGAHHIRIQNSEIMNSVKQGVLTSPGNRGGSDYNEFINNRVHHNGTDVKKDHGFYISTKNNKLINNTAYSNAAYGIQVFDQDYQDNYPSKPELAKFYSTDNTIVEGNICFDNYNGGMVISSGDSIIAKNNILYKNGWYGLKVDYKLSNSKVYNNVAYGNDIGGIVLGSTAVNTVVANNIAYNNGINLSAERYANVANLVAFAIEDSGVNTQMSNNFTDNPLFVDAAKGNFQLQPNSPAIDAGLAIPEVTEDILGNKRPMGAYDIGAYEAIKLPLEITLGDTNGSFVITNNANQAITGTLIVGLYDGNSGKMLNHKVEINKVFAPRASLVVSPDFSAEAMAGNGRYIKVFVWDTLTKMKPLVGSDPWGKM